MSDSLHVRHHMNTNVITLKPEQAVREVIDIFNRNHVFGAPVVDDLGNLVGVFSGTDCIRCTLKAKYDRGWNATVGDLMSRDVRTVEADYSILYVAEMFIDDVYRRYPVVEDNRVIGQISRFDILRAVSALEDSFA